MIHVQVEKVPLRYEIRWNAVGWEEKVEEFEAYSDDHAVREFMARNDLTLMDVLMGNFSVTTKPAS